MSFVLYILALIASPASAGEHEAAMMEQQRLATEAAIDQASAAHQTMWITLVIGLGTLYLMYRANLTRGESGRTPRIPVEGCFHGAHASFLGFWEGYSMELLTLKEAGERAGCSTKTLRNRIKTGELRALLKNGKHGQTYFVPEAELIRMMASEAPGGRSTPSEPTPSTKVATPSDPDDQGSSTVEPAAVPGPSTAAFSADVVLRLTDKLEEQARELGRFMAITERAESLEAREKQLLAERDRLANDLAEARAELTVMRREELRKSTRWFNKKRASRVEQGSSTVSTGEGAVAR